MVWFNYITAFRSNRDAAASHATGFRSLINLRQCSAAGRHVAAHIETAQDFALQRPRKSESWAAPPIEKRRNSQSNKPDADYRVARVRHDGAEDDVCRGEDEDNYRGGISGNTEAGSWTLVTFPIHKQRRRRKSKEDPIPER